MSASSKGVLWRYLPHVLIFLTVLAVYSPSVRNGFIYDDDVIIVKQPESRPLSGYSQVLSERHFPNLPYYRPVVRLTLLAQKALHGDDPAPFHLFNAVLMGLTAALVYAIFILPVCRIRSGPAALAALIFALHPMASSCVYPISSGRETLLPSFLMLASLYGLLQPGRKWSILAITAFAAALFGKEQAIVFPAMFFLADILSLSGSPPGKSLKKWIIRYSTFIPLILAYLIIRVVLFGGSEMDIRFLDHPEMPFLSYLYALQTFFAPFAQLHYEPPVAVWLSPPRVALAGLGLSLLILAVRRAEAPVRKWAIFWTGWFFIIQLPTANLLWQEALFDERYVFLASLGLMAIIASLVSSYWHRRLVWQVAIAGGTCAIVVLAAISAARRVSFESEYNFYRQWVATNPNAEVAQNNLGHCLMKKNLLTEAEAHLRTALGLNPRAPYVRHNLGIVLFKQGKIEEALREYQIARQLDPDYTVDYDLGLALSETGQIPEAIASYYEAIRKNPKLADAHFNLGLLLAREGGRPAEALNQFELAARLKPDDPEALYNMGVFLGSLGKEEEAALQYAAALTRDSKHVNAHYNMANIRFKQGRLAEAIRHYEAVLAGNPDDDQARRNMNAAQELLSHPPVSP